MTPPASHREAVLELLEETRLRPSEVGERLEKALDRRYWERLNLSLSIDVEDGEKIDAAAAADAEALKQQKLADRFATEGYFQIDSLFSEAVVEDLKTGIEAVRQAGWPAVFAFVYDQFWQTARAPKLVGLLTRILGPEFRQSCHLWSHYVPADSGAGGWPPHIDNPGRQDRVTVWIALNAATLDNACLYLIPKHLTPAGVAENFAGLDSFSHADVTALLQGGRALPVPAGSVIGWGPDVIHWSALRSSGQSHPRISISQEFLAASATPRQDELPLFPVQSRLPTFAQRLYAIATAILAYQRVETPMIRYLELAQRLVAATSTSALNARE
jgi:hypothetical protein